jgi:hydrogenase maturation protease
MTCDDRPPVRVVAAGEVLRGDDGAGPAVVERLAGRQGLEPVTVRGAAPEVLSAWAGADRVILVDAMHSGLPAGTVRVFHPGDAGRRVGGVSGHGDAVAGALALGAALGRLPGALLVVGIEAGSTRLGSGLSPAVAAAVERAVATVRELATMETWEEGNP